MKEILWQPSAHVKKQFFLYSLLLFAVAAFSHVYAGTIGISKMKRTPEELVSFVFRECSFSHGCLIMTGTGIVPEHDFTLKSGDEIKISIDGIGTLVNVVQ